MILIELFRPILSTTMRPEDINQLVTVLVSIIHLNFKEELCF